MQSLRPLRRYGLLEGDADGETVGVGLPVAVAVVGGLAAGVGVGVVVNVAAVTFHTWALLKPASVGSV